MGVSASSRPSVPFSWLKRAKLSKNSLFNGNTDSNPAKPPTSSGIFGLSWSGRDWAEAGTTLFTRHQQQQLNAQQLARLELFTEFIRFNRWVMSAYLIARSVDRLVHGISALGLGKLLSSLGGGRSVDTATANTSDPPTHMSFIKELLARNNVSWDELEDTEKVVIANGLTWSGGNETTSKSAHRNKDCADILCGMRPLKRLLRFCLGSDNKHEKADIKALRSVLLWGPPGLHVI
jgi:hypothetical protein